MLRKPARSMRIGLTDLAGLAATRTGALPSHNSKPERYVQSAWASGGQRADSDKKAPGPSHFGSADWAEDGLNRTASPWCWGWRQVWSKSPEHRAWWSGGQSQVCDGNQQDIFSQYGPEAASGLTGRQPLPARSIRFGSVDLAGLAASRMGALPSHNSKPEGYVESAWASGGQQG